MKNDRNNSQRKSNQDSSILHSVDLQSLNFSESITNLDSFSVDDIFPLDQQNKQNEDNVKISKN